jgi:alkyl hydroperoxide reductase subunit AhpC
MTAEFGSRLQVQATSLNEEIHAQQRFLILFHPLIFSFIIWTELSDCSSRNYRHNMSDNAKVEKSIIFMWFYVVSSSEASF